MRLQIKFISLLFLVFLFSIFSAKTAFADSFTLSGRVSDSSGNAISNADITVTDTNTSANVGSTTTDGSGDYIISVMDGIYNVQVTPPSGSNFSPAIALSQNISANITLNFILVPAGTVTLSGHIYDSLGNPLPNQVVQLVTSGNITETTSDNSGNYSLQVSSGTYTLAITADDNNSSLNAPQHYELISSGFSLTQSKIVDFIIPAKKVDIHVQDPSENPVSNVDIKATIPNGLIQNISIGGGIIAAGESSYGVVTNNGAQTDQSGNAILWLLPTDTNTVYNFTATPPSGSNFQPTNLTNISVTTDTQQTITLLQPINFSGHIYDSLSNAVAGQQCN